MASATESTTGSLFNPLLNGPWQEAGIPVRLNGYGGNEVTALLDLPPEMPGIPLGELTPVLLTMLFGRTKEDLGAIAEALITQRRFAVLRPAFLNSGDEAPGQLPDLVMGGDEIAWWGAYLMSEKFRTLCASLRPGITIAPRAACVAASISSPQALEAQAATGVFDAMVLLSFIPDVKEFLPRKTGKTFDEWLALEWRYRLKTAPNPENIWADIERQQPPRHTLHESAALYSRIAGTKETISQASINDFNVVVDGVPSNLRKAFSGSIKGLWDYDWDLPHMVERARKVTIPLTFIAGGRDDYYPPESLDEFIVRSREEGRTRRYIRLEAADHRLKPFTSFERAMQETVRYLLTDLGLGGVPEPFSAARAAVRKYYETRGFALRHAPKLGVPPSLTQKFLLRKEDLVGALDVLLSRPSEVALYAGLLDRSRQELGGKSILEELEPARLYRILNGVIETRHYPAIAEGLSLIPESAGALFPEAALSALDPAHLEGIFQELANFPDSTLRFLRSIEPEPLEKLGERKALLQARRALEAVPAYRDFVLARTGQEPAELSGNPPADLSAFPITSKQNFIERYPLENRCIGGQLPSDGVMDESGGSNGAPTNWVRCRAEEDRLAGGLVVLYRYLFRAGQVAENDGRPVVFLNGFSQGAWSTSTKLAVLSRYSTLSKNIGTDPEKILASIERLGPAYTYNIAGYPPFLRELVRQGSERPGFRWDDYRINILHGGEGYTSSWLRYMRRELGPRSIIVSSYGASDLELGIAYETPPALRIRLLLESRAEQRQELFGSPRQPVFFGQYNPSEFYLEENPCPDGRSSIVGTVTNPISHQPRVRYDIGDDGRLIRFRRMKEWLADRAPEISLKDALRFPFICLYGRIDGTVSLDGANVSPAQVEEGLFSNPKVAPLVRSFRMRRVERPDGSVRFEIDLETYDAAPADSVSDSSLADSARDCLTRHLLKENPDYRESYEHNRPSVEPEIRIVGPGTLTSGKSIKNRYVG